MHPQFALLRFSHPPLVQTQNMILFPSALANATQTQYYPCISLFGAKQNKFSLDFRNTNRGFLMPHAHDYNRVLLNPQNTELLEDHVVEDDSSAEVSTSEQIEEYVDQIRLILMSMNDVGDHINASAYDTAWVALAPHVDRKGVPQFPSCLQWIANNQLIDGSWGDRHHFSAYDRVISTLACVVTLKSWNIHCKKIQKGISFINENISKLETENDEHMTVAFEVILPALMEKAKELGLEIADDSPVMQEIYAKRKLKLQKIPLDIMHSEQTTLLFSLEGMLGMKGLDWEKLLKLQSPDGSFFFSLSSTAFAFMETKDENCLRYLTQVVNRFNGGVPCSYPNDMFSRLWAVDRLQRLGISRFFRSELNEYVNYVYRHWSGDGIFSASNSPLPDLDDTSMGFRFLRLHGYEVSPDVFNNFRNGDRFCCFPRETVESCTVMYNTYRASQLLFPGEKILEEAKKFTFEFLKEKQAHNQLADKWLITKDFPGEVKYALDVPWYASLPRVEARLYLDQYAGDDDAWIGKTLYRMPEISNDAYLQLAKLDYDKCQEQHLTEWDSIQKWAAENNLQRFGVTERSLLVTFFLSAASIFEPERSKERMAWAKSAVLVDSIASYFQQEQTSHDQIKAFIHLLENSRRNIDSTNQPSNDTGDKLLQTLLRTLHDISSDEVIHRGLCRVWKRWLMSWINGGDAVSSQSAGGLLADTINLSGQLVQIEEEMLSIPEYKHLLDLTDKICHLLRQFQKNKVRTHMTASNITTLEVESKMQELVKLVLQNSSEVVDRSVKDTFLTVVKSFYYAAYYSPTTNDIHIARVLFQGVF